MDILSQAFVGRHFECSSHDPHGYLRAYEDGLCIKIFEKFWGHYPKNDWKVKVNAAQGMATIQLPLLMKQSLGWNFPHQSATP
jgi:hypothetical protein